MKQLEWPEQQFILERVKFLLDLIYDKIITVAFLFGLIHPLPINIKFVT